MEKRGVAQFPEVMSTQPVIAKQAPSLHEVLGEQQYAPIRPAGTRQ